MTHILTHIDVTIITKTDYKYQDAYIVSYSSGWAINCVSTNYTKFYIATLVSICISEPFL